MPPSPSSTSPPRRRSLRLAAAAYPIDGTGSRKRAAASVSESPALDSSIDGGGGSMLPEPPAADPSPATPVYAGGKRKRSADSTTPASIASPVGGGSRKRATAAARDSESSPGSPIVRGERKRVARVSESPPAPDSSPASPIDCGGSGRGKQKRTASISKSAASVASSLIVDGDGIADRASRASESPAPVVDRSRDDAGTTGSAFSRYHASIAAIVSPNDGTDLLKSSAAYSSAVLSQRRRSRRLATVHDSLVEGDMAGDAVDLPNAEVNASSEARSERYSYEGKGKLDLEIDVFGNGRDEMVVDLTGEDEDMMPGGRRFTADEKGKGKLELEIGSLNDTTVNLTGEDEGRMPSGRRFSAEEKGKSKLVIEKDWLSLGRNDDEEQIIIEEMADMIEMDDECAPIEGRSKKRKSGRAKGRSEYQRGADRSKALELAPKFAFFKADDDEDEEGEDPDEGLDSVNIIDGREALLEARNAGLASKKVEASKISWTPATDRPPKKRVPPSLKDLCLNVLCENGEEIESLEGVPDSQNQVLGRMLCNSKKMSARALGLLVSGSPAKILLTNGTRATDEQIQAVLAMCNNGTLQVSSSSPSTMQSPVGTDPGASTTEVQMTSSTSCQTEGTSKKDAKKKLPLSFTNQGVVVGDNAAKWKSRVGHFVRSYVPIDITDFRKTPQNFLDDIWNALKEEFDFGPVDPKIVRESLELGYSQRFRTMKVTLRNEILRKAASAQEAIEACPIGIDPGHWENFVKREFKPEVIAANLRNKTNKQSSSSGHTLGRRTYAQNNHIRQQKHPEKEICRTEDWLSAHEKPDGTPLESAKEKYLLVKEAQNRRKNASMGEGNSSTHTDLDSDELAEVFGRDIRGRVRGVGSNISRKQFLQSAVTTSIVEEKNASSYRDVKTDVAELKTTVSRVEDMTTAMYRWQCASLRHEVPDHQNFDANMTPRTKTCSHSINKQVSSSPPTGFKVKLCDREGTEVARGHVVTDSTSGICHSRRVLPGERKVYVEEVLIGNALVYDGPQDGNSTMEGFVGGGYVIWLEARLEKV